MKLEDILHSNDDTAEDFDELEGWEHEIAGATAAFLVKCMSGIVSQPSKTLGVKAAWDSLPDNYKKALQNLMSDKALALIGVALVGITGNILNKLGERDHEVGASFYSELIALDRMKIKGVVCKADRDSAYSEECEACTDGNCMFRSLTAEDYAKVLTPKEDIITNKIIYQEKA